MLRRSFSFRSRLAWLSLEWLSRLSFSQPNMVWYPQNGQVGEGEQQGAVGSGRDGLERRSVDLGHSHPSFLPVRTVDVCR